MPAVPTQGGNNNTWGTDLNAFLAVHANLATGLLAAGVATGAALGADVEITSRKDAANGYAGLDANAVHKAIEFSDGGTRAYESFGGAPGLSAVNQAAAVATMYAWMRATPGGCCLFGPAIYLNMPQIVLPHRCGIRGVGMMATTLKVVNGLNADFIVNEPAAASIGGATNGKFVFVKDMNLDGNKANQSSGRGIVWTEPNPGSPGAGDDDPDSHSLIENVRLFKFKQDGVANSGASENRCINVYAAFCDGNSFAPGFDTWTVVCTSSQAGLAGISDSSPSSRVIGTKCFYSGQVTASAGIGFRFFTQSGGVMQATGCEAQDNKAAGYAGDTARNISIIGAADSNSTSIAGAYPALDVFACKNSTFNIVCMDRQWDAINNTQTGALQVRSGSKYNSIRVTHYAAVGAVSDPIIQWSTDSTPNDVSINGSPNGPYGYAVGTFASTYTPTPLGGYTISDASVPGGNCIKITLTGPITVAAVAAGQQYPGQALRFLMVQDSTGGRTITWNGVYKTPPAATTTLSTTQVYDFIFDGTNYRYTGGAPAAL